MTFLKSANNQTDYIYEQQKERIKKVDELIDEAEQSLNKLKSEFTKCAYVHPAEQTDETTGDSSDSEYAATISPLHVFNVIKTEIGDMPHRQVGTSPDPMAGMRMNDEIASEHDEEEQSQLNTISERTEQEMDEPSDSSTSCECVAMPSPTEPNIYGVVKTDIDSAPQERMENSKSSDKSLTKMQLNIFNEATQSDLTEISEGTKGCDKSPSLELSIHIVENKKPATKLTMRLLQQINIRPSLSKMKPVEILKASNNVYYEEVVHADVTDVASLKLDSQEFHELKDKYPSHESEKIDLVNELPKEIQENNRTDESGAAPVLNFDNSLLKSIDNPQVSYIQEQLADVLHEKKIPKTEIIVPYLKELCDCDLEKINPPNIAYVNELYKDKSESEQQLPSQADTIKMKSPSASSLDVVINTSYILPKKLTSTIPFTSEQPEKAARMSSDLELTSVKNATHSTDSMSTITNDVSSQVSHQSLNHASNELYKDKSESEQHLPSQADTTKMKSPSASSSDVVINTSYILAKKLTSTIPFTSEEKAARMSSDLELTSVKKAANDSMSTIVTNDVSSQVSHQSLNHVTNDNVQNEVSNLILKSAEKMSNRDASREYQLKKIEKNIRNTEEAKENENWRTFAIKDNYTTKQRSSEGSEDPRSSAIKENMKKKYSAGADAIKSHRKKSRRNTETDEWIDDRIAVIRNSIKWPTNAIDSLDRPSVAEKPNVDEYLRISGIAEKQKQLMIEAERAKRRKRRSTNNNASVMTVSVHYSDKCVQGAIEDLPVTSLELLRANCDKNCEGYKHNRGTKRKTFNNMPYGDNISQQGHLKLHPNGRYEDEAHDFCKSTSTKLMKKNKRFKKGSKLHLQNISVTSSDSTSYKLDGAGVDLSHDCKCSASIGELDFCHDADELKKQTPYFKKHPEELLKFEFNENNVHILAQKAYYENWVAYYTCATTSPTESDSNDRLSDT